MMRNMDARTSIPPWSHYLRTFSGVDSPIPRAKIILCRRKIERYGAIDRLELDLEITDFNDENHARGRRYNPRHLHRKLAPGPKDAWWNRPVKVRISGIEYERVISKVLQSSGSSAVIHVDLEIFILRQMRRNSRQRDPLSFILRIAVTRRT
ncbi:hypothetical protein B0H34DRAFT_398370 [Crassisporium funariophilum]|nr:hypothetical protein B0H34DRAFT_398370 [Crassisporium funariophilum]